jgi:hypothetical protein
MNIAQRGDSSRLRSFINLWRRGGVCYTQTCSLTTRMALPTENGTHGQTPTYAMRVC